MTMWIVVSGMFSSSSLVCVSYMCRPYLFFLLYRHTTFSVFLANKRFIN